MPKVQVLPDALVNQIAAGEVVERPASVVKELVENALDAGATRVLVEADGGGIEAIRVADDGCGMGPEDARLALERHATSKIRSLDDLARVASLGFRGEALPSIASVSRLVLLTSPDESGLGTEVTAERGAPPVLRPARATRGTRVTVEDLFGNVPARRKFLKGADAEQRALTRSLTALALSRPDVRFSLVAKGRSLLDLPPARDALGRFAELMGTAPGEVVPVAFELSGMTLEGAVTAPSTTYASRTNQWLFVNGRAVKDGTVTHAAQLAAREVLRDARHPGFVLFLTVDPALCDVNVHPQKLEVRFKEPSAVHSLVHRGLAAALTGGKGAVPLGGGSLLLRRVAPFGAAPPAADAARASAPADRFAEGPSEWGGALRPGPAALSTLLSPVEPAPAGYPEPAPAESPVGSLRLLGQYRESYLVAEGEDGIVLVDQHVAHERVRYERILASLAGKPAPSQRLLLPVPFEATADEAAQMQRADALLTVAGFTVSELSGRTFLVSAAPADLSAERVGPFLRDFLSRLAALPEGGEGEASSRAREALAASLACRGAVTVNTRLSPAEAARLLSDLSVCRDPYTCPHGRPILLSLPHGELLKRFGRRS